MLGNRLALDAEGFFHSLQLFELHSLPLVPNGFDSLLTTPNWQMGTDLAAANLLVANGQLPIGNQQFVYAGWCTQWLRQTFEGNYPFLCL